ncbi:MAG: insulinase family protein [Candidatus Aminicenantes bacterium]|nr:insulinase family protein [Candidatus Aminicenantes bacterium]
MSDNGGSRRRSGRNGGLPAGLALLLALSAGAAGQSQERFRRSQPNPDPLPELGLPAVETHRLSNGLRLAVVRRDSLPLLSLQLLILAGEAQSPPDRPGTATLTARMITQGTELISAEDVQNRIEALGAELTVATRLDYTLFGLNVLDDQFERALTLLAPLFQQPAFPKRDLDAVKRTLRYTLLERNQDPAVLAKRQLLHLLFPNHPYRNGLFADDALRAVEREHVQAFYDAYYRPNNAVLVLCGAIGLSTATGRVSQHLNTWAPKDLPPPPLAPVLPEPVPRVCLVDLPQSRDATLAIGAVVGPAGAPDALPLEILSQVLGGTPTSRLFMELRETKGYAFYAFSELELYRSCGLFLIRARVQPEFSGASIRSILAEVERAVTEPLPSYEIEQAKSRLIGNVPLRFEAFDRLALRVAEIHAFNLNEADWSRPYESIMLVNAEAVHAAALKTPLRTPVVVIVGDKSVVLDHLQDFKTVEVYNVKGVFQYNVTRGG